MDHQQPSRTAHNSNANNEHIPDLKTESQADLHSTIPLDALFFEGDDSPAWNPNDWSWDPYQLSAEQREPGAGETQQQPKKRKLPQEDTANPLPSFQHQRNLAGGSQLSTCQPHANEGISAYQQLLLGAVGSDGSDKAGIYGNLTGPTGPVCNSTGCPCWRNPSTDCGCPCCEQGAAGESTSQAGSFSTSQAACAEPVIPQVKASMHQHHMSQINQLQLGSSQLIQQLLSEQQQLQHVQHTSSAQPQPVTGSYQQHQAALFQQTAHFAYLQSTARPQQTNTRAPSSQGASPSSSRSLPTSSAQAPPFPAWNAQQQSMPSSSSLPRSSSLPQPHLPNLVPSLGKSTHLSQNLECNMSSPGFAGAGASETLATAGSSGLEDELESEELLGDSDRRTSVKEEGEYDDISRLVCQVPGCCKELAVLKDYHQRYRICDVHIKLAQVMKDGRLQRFCQQCGRFHDLGAFDGNRKSCREQLSKHNARRRRRTNVAATAMLPDDLSHAADEKSEIGRLLQGLIQNPSQLHALRILLGIQTHPAMPAMAGQAAAQGDAHAPAPPKPPPLAPVPSAADPGTYAEAREILVGAGRYAPTYDAGPLLSRLSIKLFNREPTDLPSDLRQSLHGWLGVAPAGLEAYIRPGCVFLTLHILMEEGAGLPGPDPLASLVKTLTLDRPHRCWTQGLVALQLEKQLLMLSDGVVRQRYDMTAEVEEALKLPSLLALGPCCAVHPLPAAGTVRVTIQGRRLAQPDCRIICRCNGATLVVEAPQVGTQAEAQEGGAQETMSLTVHLQGTNDVVFFEANRGAFLSEVIPLLVVDDSAIAIEINRLKSSKVSAATQSAVLVDLGLVLQAAAGPPKPFLTLDQAVTRARHLLAFACDQGWARVVRRLLPIAAMGCRPTADVVNRVEALTAKSDGLGLMHRAVRSGNPDVVRELFAWGSTHLVLWPVDFGGPRCITPLHLAALQQDAAATLMLLMEHSHPQAFTTATSRDGVTPFQIAFQMGLHTLETIMTHLAPQPRLFRRRRQQGSTDRPRPGFPPHSAATAAAAPAAAAAAAAQGASSARRGPSAAAAWKPLVPAARPKRPGKGTVLGPCTLCGSSLPLLLLSATTHCQDCEQRVSGEEGRLELALHGGPGEQGRGGPKDGRESLPPRPARGGAVWSGVSPSAPARQACLHVGHVVHQLVGLCQTCHAEQMVDVM